MSDALLPKSNTRLRIGFVHRFNAQNIRSWSGTFFFMARALEEHVGEVIYLGPDESAGTKFIIDNTARVNRIWQRITGKILATDHNRVLSKRLARFFESRLTEQHCDILFAPAASVEIAEIKTRVPIVYSSDTTWADVIDYYPEYSGLSSIARLEGERIEAAAITRADAIVYPSDWAIRTALDHYNSPAEKIHRVPFGANLEVVPTRAVALHHPLNGKVNLLLVGVDWERKGGPIAFECLRSLLDRGIDAHLTVCGCIPPPEFNHPNIQVIPFLNKNEAEQQQRMSRLFQNSHFLLFPTRAEAMGIVTCEASAHGLPALVAQTGGTKGALKEGVNGFLMPFAARGDAYADKILSVIADPARYEALVTSSRDEYENFLNWDAWGRSVRSVVERLLHRKIDVDSRHEAIENGNGTGGDSVSQPPSAEIDASLAAEVTHS
jgi:glycosyltransferase involved in cell wall biosynthesis